MTGICIFGSEDRVLVGTSQGFLLCYDLTGKQVWHRLFDRAIRHFLPIREDVIVVDRLGGLHRVTPWGDLQEMEPLPAACSIAVTDASGAWFACGTEILRMAVDRKTAPPNSEKKNRP